MRECGGAYKSPPPGVPYREVCDSAVRIKNKS